MQFEHLLQLPPSSSTSNIFELNVKTKLSSALNMEPNPQNTFNSKPFSPLGADAILTQMEELSLKENKSADHDTLLPRMERPSIHQNRNLDCGTTNPVNTSTVLAAIPEDNSDDELPWISSYGGALRKSNARNTQPRDNGTHLKTRAGPSKSLPSLTLDKHGPASIRDITHTSTRNLPVNRKIDFHSEAEKTIKKSRGHQEAPFRRKNSAGQRIMSRIAAYEARECQKSQGQLPAKKERKVRFNNELKIIYPSTSYLDFGPS